jgi:hypothetical protein
MVHSEISRLWAVQRGLRGRGLLFGEVVGCYMPSKEAPTKVVGGQPVTDSLELAGASYQVHKRQSLQYGSGRATADISDPERWDDFSKPFLFLA